MKAGVELPFVQCCSNNPYNFPALKNYQIIKLTPVAVHPLHFLHNFFHLQIITIFVVGLF